jgi:hypothetical protein
LAATADEQLNFSSAAATISSTDRPPEDFAIKPKQGAANAAPCLTF